MSLVIQFLNVDDSTFLATDPQHLQLRQLEPGKCALGVSITRPKLNEDKSPVLDKDGQPQFEAGFIPVVNYDMDIAAPQPEPAAPKVELATEVPQNLKRKSKLKSNKVAQ